MGRAITRSSRVIAKPIIQPPYGAPMMGFATNARSFRGLHVASIDKPAGLPPPQRRIMAVESEQRIMCALLDDAAAFEHDQPVHSGDGREPMRDGDHGLARHQGAEALLDGGFDFAVE